MGPPPPAPAKAFGAARASEDAGAEDDGADLLWLSLASCSKSSE